MVQDCENMKHLYSRKALASMPYHVVYVGANGIPTFAVSGRNQQDDAVQDAADRNRRVKEYNLDCTYIVRSREQGMPAGD